MAEESTISRWRNVRSTRRGSPRSVRLATGNVGNGDGWIHRGSFGRHCRLAFLTGCGPPMVTRHARCDTGDMWNPDVYLAFADQRGRPFFDLLSRVAPRTRAGWSTSAVGPAISRSALLSAGPDAAIEAWDSSPEMVEAARERGVDAAVGDVRDLDAEAGHRRGGEQRHRCSGCPNTPSCWSDGRVSCPPGRGSRCRCRAISTRRHIRRCGPWRAARRSQTRCATCRFATAVVDTAGRIREQCSPTRAAPSTRGRPPMSTS